MGIVARQGIKNTIYSFVGVALGAIYTLFIVPRVFEQNPDEWGLIQLINSYVLLFMPFALLGFPNSIIRYWPKYDDIQKQGFLTYLLALILSGLVIVSIVIYILRKQIFFSTDDANLLINRYFYYFFPILFIHTCFYIYIYFTRVFLKTSYPTFIKDTFIKIWTFGLIVAYFYFKFSYNSFFLIYYSAFILQLIFLIIYSRRVISFNYRIDFSFFKGRGNRELLGYSLFSVLSGITSVVITRIDLLMINKFINLQEVAFYSVALFFITVMQIPARSIGTIIMPILSDFLHADNKREIKSLYNKTTKNLFLSESFILLIILLNLNEFMEILGETFGQVKYVILILGIAKLYELVNYLNYSLIIFTRFYKYELLFQVILLSLTVLTNIILIPRYGIEGAAMATALTLFINTTIRGIFVFLKYNLLPFSQSSVKILVLIALSVLATVFINPFMNVYLMIGLKCSIVLIIFIFGSLLLKISNEVNVLFEQFKHLIGVNKKN